MDDILFASIIIVVIVLLYYFYYRHENLTVKNTMPHFLSSSGNIDQTNWQTIQETPGLYDRAISRWITQGTGTDGKLRSEVITSIDNTTGVPVTVPCGSVDEGWYGPENKDTETWIRDQGIDTKVIKAQEKFTTDQTKNVSGQTKSTGLGGPTKMSQLQVFEPEAPIPWRGLNKPQRVPIGDPTQIPDIDFSWYPVQQQILLNT
jgi:hypothetical protein